MPGSLPGSEESDEEMHFGVDGEHEGDGEDYGYEGEGEEEEVAEEAGCVCTVQNKLRNRLDSVLQ